MTGDKIRVLIVDDSSFMRNILGRMIEKETRFEVVGKAKNGEEGVAMTLELKPDIVTMDIEMPVMDGMTALSQIMEKCPTPVLMVSSLTEEGAQATLECLEKGAVDFIPKALQDKDRNIFHVSDTLHEKLIAASKAHVGGRIRPSAPVVGKPEPVKAARPSSTARMAQAEILVVGSSTGGPKALQSFLPKLPQNLRVPVVIAQHMPANFTAAMAARLDGVCHLNVVEGTHGQEIESGTVYVAPGGLHTRVMKNGSGYVLDISPDKGGESVYHPSVDILADSASEALAGKAVAVMFTGMGSDGAKGFTSLANQGAYVIAQDEETSVVYGMPKSVVEAGITKEILPLEDIAPAVIRLLS